MSRFRRPIALDMFAVPPHRRVERVPSRDLHVVRKTRPDESCWDQKILFPNSFRAKV